MTEEKKQKKSLNPVADRVEKRTKEIAEKSEKIVNEGLNIFQNLIFKLLEVRPREYKLSECRHKDSGDEK
mgnify:CR=1 FL=1|tara:strand:- start:300 stop:509 length:210 start_codon:yes stop_codon:yes gene_type:complete